MKLNDALKQTTPGPLRTQKCRCGHKCCDSWLIEPICDSVCISGKANAAVLVHAWNMLPKIRDALLSDLYPCGSCPDAGKAKECSCDQHTAWVKLLHEIEEVPGI
jgi:hypothetical protein